VSVHVYSERPEFCNFHLGGNFEFGLYAVKVVLHVLDFGIALPFQSLLIRRLASPLLSLVAVIVVIAIITVIAIVIAIVIVVASGTNAQSVFGNVRAQCSLPVMSSALN
jgi:hypothetical protein